MKKNSGNTITSLDGTSTLTEAGFLERFDEASDELDRYIDWSKAKAQGGARPGAGRKSTGKHPYTFRLKPEVHARLKAEAKEAGISISELVETRLS